RPGSPPSALPETRRAARCAEIGGGDAAKWSYPLPKRAGSRPSAAANGEPETDSGPPRPTDERSPATTAQALASKRRLRPAIAQSSIFQKTENVNPIRTHR